MNDLRYMREVLQFRHQSCQGKDLGLQFGVESETWPGFKAPKLFRPWSSLNAGTSCSEQLDARKTELSSSICHVEQGYGPKPFGAIIRKPYVIKVEIVLFAPTSYFNIIGISPVVDDKVAMPGLKVDGTRIISYRYKTTSRTASQALEMYICYRNATDVQVEVGQNRDRPVE